jgi:hypothetical protein
MRQSTNVQSCKRCIVLAFAVIALWLGSATHAIAAEGSGSCSADSEVRQLDYWLGNWTMKAADGSSTSSKVTLSLDKCMFVEHWENRKGHVTEKMFAYSPEDKNWGGMFADNQGRVHIFLAGKVSSGTAEFHGPSRGPNGETVLHKLRVVRTAPDRLQETWEKSLDNGANWINVYRAEYSRAQP